MANEVQAALWSETVGSIWLAQEARVTSVIYPHGAAAIDIAGVSSGERILDVGCGTGPTSIELARRVGPSGSVLGVDISPLLLDRARERMESSGLTNIEFEVADAQTYDLPSGFDLVFSSFGVMFFDDPVAAFANLRGSLRAGGRLAFACWQPSAVNRWNSVPAMAAASVFSMPPPPPPGTPGPFAFGDGDYVSSILSGAGFTSIDLRSNTDSVDVGFNDDEMDQVLRLSAMRDEYLEADGTKRERAFAAIREAVAPFEHDGRYRFPSASWLVTASA